MKIINEPKLVVSFGSNNATIGDNYIVKDSITVAEQLMNDLKSSSNRVSLRLTKDCPVIDVILKTNDNIKAVLYDGTTILFNGYVSSKYTWGVTSSGLKTFDITLEDSTKVLQKKYSENSVLLNDTVSTIVSDICSICGISQNPYNPVIDEVAVCEVEGGTKCVDILDDLLFEAGYLYRFDNLGRLTLFDNAISPNPVGVMDKSNLYVKGASDAVSIEKSLIQYDQAYVNYTSLKTKTSVSIYKDISGQDATHPNCNITVDSGYAYPSQVPYEGKEDYELEGIYDVVDLDEGKDVVYYDNLDIKDGVSLIGSGLSYSIRPVDHKKLAVLVRNSGAIPAYVTKLSAKGNLCVVNSYDKVIAPSSGDSPISVDMKYLHSKQSASRLANILYDYYSKCNFTYTFHSTTEYKVGDVVTLNEDIFSGISTNVFINKRQYSKGIYTYTAFSVSQFNIERPVKSQQTLPIVTPHTVRPSQTIQVEYCYGDDPDNPPSEEMVWGDYDIVIGSEDTTWNGDGFDTTLTGDGRYVWMRTKVGDGEWTYTRMTGIEAIDYNLYTIPDVYSLNSRGVVETEQTITVVAEPNTSLTNRDITPVWTFGGTYNGVTKTDNGWETVVSIPVGVKYESIVVNCSLANVNDKSISITGVRIGAPKPKYWGQCETTPTEDPLYPFMDGDYFLDISIQSDGKYNNVPKVRRGDNWYEMNASDPTFAQAMLDCGTDILKDASPTNSIRTQTVIYSYIKNLMAENAVIDNLFARNIQLFDNGTTQGQISSQGYNEGQKSKGFVIKQDGTARFVDVTIDGTSVIGGDSEIQGTIVNRDSEDNVIFRTNKGDTTTKTITGSSTNHNPSAIAWAELKPVLLAYGKSVILNNEPLSAFDSVINGRALKDINYCPSVNTEEKLYKTVTVDNVNTTQTLTLYDNVCQGKTIHLSSIYVKKSVDWNISTSSMGSARMFLYNRSTGAETEIYNNPAGGTNASDAQLYTYNLAVPKGCSLKVTMGGAPHHGGFGSGESAGYCQVFIRESDNWQVGVNVSFEDGTSMLLDALVPNSGYATSAQKLKANVSITSSNLYGEIYCPLTQESSWPAGVNKYYNLHYSTTGLSASTTEASFFDTKTLVIDGKNYDVGGIAYSRDRITMFTTDGAITLSNSDFLRWYSFNFVTTTSPQGAYAKNLMPTTTTSSIGGSSSDSIWNEIYGGNIYYRNLSNLSKAEYKEDIEDFTDNSTDIIKSVAVKSFVYKDDEDRNYQIGFIADDTDWRLSGKNHDRMDISNCIGVLMKAVQELTKRIEELENR